MKRGPKTLRNTFLYEELQSPQRTIFVVDEKHAVRMREGNGENMINAITTWRVIQCHYCICDRYSSFINGSPCHENCLLLGKASCRAR